MTWKLCPESNQVRRAYSSYCLGPSKHLGVPGPAWGLGVFSHHNGIVLFGPRVCKAPGICCVHPLFVALPLSSFSCLPSPDPSTSHFKEQKTKLVKALGADRTPHHVLNTEYGCPKYRAGEMFFQESTTGRDSKSSWAQHEGTLSQNRCFSEGWWGQGQVTALQWIPVFPTELGAPSEHRKNMIFWEGQC